MTNNFVTALPLSGIVEDPNRVGARIRFAKIGCLLAVGK